MEPLEPPLDPPLQSCPVNFNLAISYIILDDRKNFQFLKRGIGIESEKYANKLEIKKVWKQVKDGAQ